jgi:hypothetical protein
MSYDFNGNDIMNAGSILRARAECDSRPSCVAFNSGGWVKGPTLPPGGASLGTCVWVKNPVPPPPPPPPPRPPEPQNTCKLHAHALELTKCPTLSTCVVALMLIRMILFLQYSHAHGWISAPIGTKYVRV